MKIDLRVVILVNGSLGPLAICNPEKNRYGCRMYILMRDQSNLYQIMSLSRTYRLVRKRVYQLSKKTIQICCSRINEKIMCLISEDMVVV